MTKKIFDIATDPHQYDSMDMEWGKEGNVDSPTRKYFQYYLSQKLKVKDLSVLDVGCGLGQLFPLLKEKGAKEIVGIEPSKKSVLFAQKQYPECQIIESSLEDYKPQRTFDAVISVLVFEHIKDVGASFERIHQLLNPGGPFYLIIADKDYSTKPRFNYEMEVEELSKEEAAVRTKRNYGMAYDVYRSVEYYIDCAKKSGFSLEEHLPIIPNEETVKFMPHYKDFLGIATAHLFIFK
jgi:2-polyprenyl-3-methyl-5-hydroxy-6-metoxy-1,4-benzoquinol methylase